MPGLRDAGEAAVSDVDSGGPTERDGSEKKEHLLPVSFPVMPPQPGTGGRRQSTWNKLPATNDEWLVMLAAATVTSHLTTKKHKAY